MPTDDYRTQEISPFDLLMMIAQGSRILMATPLGYMPIVRGIALDMVSRAYDAHLRNLHANGACFTVSVHQHPSPKPMPQVVVIRTAPECCQADTIESAL